MSVDKKLLEASVQASKNYGIPVEVILGFAGVETSFGTTGVGKSKNNLFGIMNGDGTAKSYSSIEESVEDFAKLVTGNKDSSQSKKYGEATANATTTEQWVNAIRDSGYNSEYEDGVYEEKVMDVVKDLDLSLDDMKNADTSSNTLGLKWWGDIIIVVAAVLLIVGAVAFLGLSVTSTSSGSKSISKIKDIVKEVV